MSKFTYVIGFLGVVLAAIWLAIFSVPNESELAIIACDVGQGDAFIILWKDTQVLVDGGPNNDVVNCLDSHMPFWDRNIEVVILTNADRDHYFGLIETAERYQIDNFVLPTLEKTDSTYLKLISLVDQKQIPKSNLYAGDTINIKDLSFDILWPAKEVSGNANTLSYVFNLKFGDFSMAFTGDIEPPGVDQMLAIGRANEVDILKVPHHGSKNGLTQSMLDAFDPNSAIISSGLTNQWGHPNKETLDILEGAGIMIFRTDQMGEIKITTNGDSYQVIP